MSMTVLQGGHEPPLTKAQIADLKLKHGDDLVRVVEDATYVFRPPTKAEYARYVAGVTKKRDDLTDTSERLALDRLVYPTNGEGEPDGMRLAKLFEKKAGIGMNIAGKLQDLAGAGDDADVGKL